MPNRGVNLIMSKMRFTFSYPSLSSHAMKQVISTHTITVSRLHTYIVNKVKTSFDGFYCGYLQKY